ncbi:oxidative stress-responsive serine-rich protein 1 isoform X2 [Odontomachus brunneus]|uniref:oxidative stress-responsive serine-rich protein 1 isoform X2 n=1 Tax=Odontomachus brunneus TaxID=486640 RepID=UPI0013F2127C|nr:oxidative stress-responsive serine-rich protein 1 isoform X2 [Odontomachus brunneus]
MLLVAEHMKMNLSIATTDKPKTTNPFRTLNRSYASASDHRWLFRRRSMPNRPTVFAANPRGIKSTTNFKPSKSERVAVEKSKRGAVLREAMLKLNAPGTGCLSDNLVDTLKNSCKFNISNKSSKRIESESIARDLKELEMRRDCRQSKDDTSIQDDDYEAAGYQRTRSNTMPSLKRGPGPGGGLASSSSGGQTDAAGPSSGGQPSSTNTCSVQARISPPSCDITIGELASYFEEFVHIPKKMSHMAEMMYT